jgi:hypothetical protein
MKSGAAIVALLAAAYVVYRLARAGPTYVPEPEPVADRGSPLGSPSVVAPLPARAPPVAYDDAAPEEPGPRTDPPPNDRVAFNARKAEMTRRALHDVQQRIDYPLWSSPLTENLEYKPPYAAHTMMRGPGGGFPSLEIYPEKLNYGSGETVRIIAAAHGENGLIGFDALTGRTMGPPDKPRPDIALEWSQQPDGTFAAALDIPADVAGKNRGEWDVEVDSQINGEHRIGHTQFYEMITDATITGPNRVALEDGSLSVYVTITSTASNRQHLIAELWGPRDEKIAYAWVRTETGPAPVGRSEMKLVFYGKTIRDSGVDGPYQVRNMVLTTVMPDTNDRIANPVVDPGPVTPALLHTQFTDVPINGDNAMLADKQRILEQELQKAEANGYDPTQREDTPAQKADKHGPQPQ